jgi:hypothetical protein
MRDASVLIVFAIAWGYDMGERFADVTTNVSPDVTGASVDLFWTTDPSRSSPTRDTRALIFPRASLPIPCGSHRGAGCKPGLPNDR